MGDVELANANLVQAHIHQENTPSIQAGLLVQR
jgi:hypothetical protein